MEEKKNEVNKNQSQRKMTYEELQNALGQANAQIQILYRNLQQANISNQLKRLDYLFEVVKNSEKFKNEKFVIDCITEIMDSLIIPDEEEEGGDYIRDKKE